MIKISWSDIEGLHQLEGALNTLASQHRVATVSRIALNRTGDMAKTQVVRALTKQTGLKRPVIVKAVKVAKANYGSLNYVMTTKGGDISLKYFAARETRRGVSAAPFGQRKVFASTFLNGGRFPGRVLIPGFKGHVFQRLGGSRLPIEKLKSGVFIPVEMIKGETVEVFKQTVKAQLPRRIEHELKRLTGGVFG